MHELVRRFDRNGDGVLEFTELAEGLLKMNIILNDIEMQLVMTKLDLNKDGGVTYEELLQLLEGYDTK